MKGFINTPLKAKVIINCLHVLRLSLFRLRSYVKRKGLVLVTCEQIDDVLHDKF